MRTQLIHRRTFCTSSIIFLACAMLLSACEATAAQLIPTDRPTATLTFTPSPTRTPAGNITATPRPTQVADAATAGPSPTPLFGATRTPLPENFVVPTRSLNPNAPRIEFFTSDPLSVQPGESVTLYWSARNVDVATIFQEEDGVRLPLYEVPPDGSEEISTRSSDRGQLAFVLAIGDGAERVEQGIVIPLQCPVAWFFAPPPDTCADTAPVESRIIDQDFERGRMVYIEESNTIYALFNDGRSPAWLAFDNSYDPDIHAERDPNFPQLPNRVQPLRELGLLWRGNDVVRNRLGLGTRDEVAFIGFVQTSTPARNRENVYVSSSDNSVLHIVPGREQWQIIAP